MYLEFLCCLKLFQNLKLTNKHTRIISKRPEMGYVAFNQQRGGGEGTNQTKYFKGLLIHTLALVQGSWTRLQGEGMGAEQPPWTTASQFLRSLNMQPHTAQRRNPRIHVHSKIRTWIFIAASCVRARKRRQPACPLTGGWLNDHIHTREYYSATQKERTTDATA